MLPIISDDLTKSLNAISLAIIVWDAQKVNNLIDTNKYAPYQNNISKHLDIANTRYCSYNNKGLQKLREDLENCSYPFDSDSFIPILSNLEKNDIGFFILFPYLSNDCQKAINYFYIDNQTKILNAYYTLTNKPASPDHK